MALQLLNRLRERHPDSLWMHCMLVSVLSLMKREDEVLAPLNELLERPDLPVYGRLWLMQMAIDGLGKRHDITAIRHLHKRMSGWDLPKDIRATLLDGFACASFYYDCPELLDEADIWITEALKLSPDSTTLKGTRAALLIERSQNYVVAKPMLENVLRDSDSASDQGTARFYLALCAKQAGNQAEARDLAETAAKLHPEHWLVQRKAREFESCRESISMTNRGVAKWPLQKRNQPSSTK